MSEWTETASAGSGGGTTVSSTEPSNPSKGDEWVDTFYDSPAKKVYDGEEWITLVEGSYAEKTFTSNHVKNVSDINKNVRIELVAAPGKEAYEWNPHTSTGAGGAGVVEVDLTPYNRIDIRPGWKEGESGTSGGRYGGNYDSGAGGDATAILDGSGNTIAVAGGGGGAASWENTVNEDGVPIVEGAYGGDGAPTSSIFSGDGGTYVQDSTDYGSRAEEGIPATDGGLVTKKDTATVLSQFPSRNQPSVTMFK